MDDPIPISALQHWCYCPRQCALIHQEQAFAENVFTLRGQAVHAKVDMPGFETRAGVRVEKALPIWHEKLGLIGKADVVEFLADGTPYPVEYKHGSKNKAAHIAICDEVQLAAQALCLEEMTGRQVVEGALFYAKTKRRKVVRITDSLRDLVAQTVYDVRAMMISSCMPTPVNDERCRHCSLVDLCQPQTLHIAQCNEKALQSALFDPDA